VSSVPALSDDHGGNSSLIAAQKAWGEGVNRRLRLHSRTPNLTDAL
jgi:hypothetical protein